VIFDYVRLLFHANDMKLFLSINGFQDCMKIQSDLNKLSEWCERNSMFLNIYNLYNILENTLSCGVCLYAGCNGAGSGELYKRSGDHHGRENEFFGACGRHGW
jgi:hypothetical protein